MLLKKLLAGAAVTAAALCASAISAAAVNANTTSAAEVAKYSYTVTPLLSPFNEYFFVKTDNPDPLSFRFADKSTKYSEDGGSLSVNYDSWDEKMKLYADVAYENESTGRVKDGYIFSGSYTDGGEVTLQYKKEISYQEYDKLNKAGDPNIGYIKQIIESSGSGGGGWQSYSIAGYYKWEDTGIKVTLPKLKNCLDYLIDTYATKSSFFENMDAVQEGFSSICLYSGSSIRGELYKKPDSFWCVTTYNHTDQSFYIFSPYDRKNGKSLFATAIYPYRYDSLGFPSMMSSVAKALEPSCTVEWNSYSHAHISVTFGGETKSYGGQGNGEGQGITEDKIIRTFTFAKSEPALTLESAKKLLQQYAGLKIPDDIPRDDELTWEQIANKAGPDGMWIMDNVGRFAFVYKDPDSDYYSSDEWGVGYQIYWGGAMGYASDTWVDGRYVGNGESVVLGEKFEDHPTSDIILLNYKFPEVTFSSKLKYDYDAKKYYREYSDVKVTEKTKTVRFHYNSSDNRWEADSGALPSGSYFYNMEELVEKGLLAQKYLDDMVLTQAEVKALKIDRNTESLPRAGYNYSGKVEPGTPLYYYKGDVNRDGVVDLLDVTILARRAAEWDGYGFYTCDTFLGDMDNNGVLDLVDVTLLARSVAEWDTYPEKYIV